MTVVAPSNSTNPLHSPAVTPAGEWRMVLRSFGGVLAALVAILVLVAALGAAADEPQLAGDVIALAIPAFVAGIFSILSPCSLPIVVGYFSIALQEQRSRIGAITVAFLTGVGTTMAVIGAGFTALGSFAIEYQVWLAQIGGVLVIGFGVMSLLGKGFAGYSGFNRPAASISGAYLYGLIFALGWTTCIGPILGSILTLLLVQGSTTAGALSLAAGGSLALIYVLGLGLPIMLLVGALRSAGPQSRIARALRGRGWEVTVFGRTLYLHSTQVVSGLLLIFLGILLLTGQMTEMSEQLASSRLAQVGVDIEAWIDRMLR